MTKYQEKIYNSLLQAISGKRIVDCKVAIEKILADFIMLGYPND